MVGLMGFEPSFRGEARLPEIAGKCIISNRLLRCERAWMLSGAAAIAPPAAVTPGERIQASRQAPLARRVWAAFLAPRDRLGEGFSLPAAMAASRCACRRVAAETVPFFGSLNLTPARRASESPMAIACWRE